MGTSTLTWYSFPCPVRQIYQQNVFDHEVASRCAIDEMTAVRECLDVAGLFSISCCLNFERFRLSHLIRFDFRSFRTPPSLKGLEIGHMSYYLWKKGHPTPFETWITSPSRGRAFFYPPTVFWPRAYFSSKYAPHHRRPQKKRKSGKKETKMKVIHSTEKPLHSESLIPLFDYRWHSSETMLIAELI